MENVMTKSKLALMMLMLFLSGIFIGSMINLSFFENKIITKCNNFVISQCSDYQPPVNMEHLNNYLDTNNYLSVVASIPVQTVVN